MLKTVQFLTILIDRIPNFEVALFRALKKLKQNGKSRFGVLSQKMTFKTSLFDLFGNRIVSELKRTRMSREHDARLIRSQSLFLNQPLGK